MQNIRNVYVPQEAIAYLDLHKGWAVISEIAFSHDISVIELETDILTEFIGINNYHKLKSDGDDVNSEINFSIITTESKLGIWVKAVLAGTIKPFYL